MPELGHEGSFILRSRRHRTKSIRQGFYIPGSEYTILVALGTVQAGYFLLTVN
jgi:hypothetical protein